jgi:hypothetical protein
MLLLSKRALQVLRVSGLLGARLIISNRQRLLPDPPGMISANGLWIGPN